MRLGSRGGLLADVMSEEAFLKQEDEVKFFIGISYVCIMVYESG